MATSSKKKGEPELSTLSECEAAFRRLFRETSAPFDLTFHSVDGCHYQVRWTNGDIDVEWIHGRKPFRVGERRVIGQLAIPMFPGRSDSSVTLGRDLVTVPRSEDRTLEKQFVHLAKVAGSLLPATLFSTWSNVVGELDDNPESLWFAMLFSGYADPLGDKVKGKPRFRREVTVYKPIDASIRMAAEIVQRGQNATRPAKLRDGDKHRFDEELDRDSQDWIQANSDCMKQTFNLKTSSLRTARSRGWKMKDDSGGIDKSGRRWRRDPDDMNTIWYLKSSLTVNRRGSSSQ